MTDRERAGGPDTWWLASETAREEAERLVAAGLTAVSVAADRIGAPSRERGGAAAAGYDALGDMLFGPAGHRRHSVANGSAECCRCPVCRVISAARQPAPEFGARLATGVGSMAGGAVRLLRAVAGPGPAPGQASPSPSPAAATATATAPPAGPDPDPAPPAGWDPWAAATAPESGPGAAPDPERGPAPA